MNLLESMCESWVINQRIKSNPILKKLLNKIIKYLKKEKEIQKKLFGNELPFSIYLFHDEELDLLALNLKSGLEGLFNVDVTKDTSIEKYFDILKSKETKHIIIFLINNEKMISDFEEKIKVLNEMKYSPTQGYGVSCYKSNFSWPS